jgi:hypothetical protein
MAINNVPYTSMRSDRVKESPDIMVRQRDLVTIEFSDELDELDCLALPLKPNIPLLQVELEQLVPSLNPYAQIR